MRKGNLAMVATGLVGAFAVLIGLAGTAHANAFRPAYSSDVPWISNDGAEIYNSDTSSPRFVVADYGIGQFMSPVSKQATVYVKGNGQTLTCWLLYTDVTNGNVDVGPAVSTTSSGNTTLFPTTTVTAPFAHFVVGSVLCQLGKLVGANYSVVWGVR
jgi:hypothetical protein